MTPDDQQAVTKADVAAVQLAISRDIANLASGIGSDLRDIRTEITGLRSDLGAIRQELAGIREHLERRAFRWPWDRV